MKNSNRSDRKKHTYTKCECLDFVEAVHRKRVYPLMTCHMELAGQLDIECLKEAVRLSGQIIPEILYAYDFKRARFVDHGYASEDVVKKTDAITDKAMVWNLDKGPQLRIFLSGGEGEESVTIGMSHILTDAEGFKQYLYLLCTLYNGWCPSVPLRNHRKIALLSDGACLGQATLQTRYGKKVSTALLGKTEGKLQYYNLTQQINSNDFIKLHTKCRESHVTLNDVFMTAYVRVIARRQNTERVVIPCPANLRSFQKLDGELTVANMTGLYRRINVEISSGQEFADTLAQIHIEMLLQKSRYRCFQGLSLLEQQFRRLPHFLLEQIIKVTYRIPPVSYSNFGILDWNKISFTGCVVNKCYLTGTYRLQPDFQLSVSTFRDTVTLNCVLAGDEVEKEECRNILNEVKNELKMCYTIPETNL